MGAAVVHTLYGETMGTRWRVCLVAPARAALDALHDAVQRRLDGVVAQMSTWEAESDISRFARAAGGTWQALPQDFFDVLRCALDVAARSGGAFDPTIAPLVRLWGFGANAGPQRVPDAEAIEAIRARIGWQRLLLHGDDRAALQPGRLELDLSAIAKGFGVDAVAETLRARGIAAALVDVGGELYGYGRKPDGEAWRVLVEATPDDDDGGDGLIAADPEADSDGTHAPCVIALDGIAIATSGDHWHRFEHDGRRYSHTIDPRSAAPVTHAPAAVTVIADSAMLADAWATALTVMGTVEGHAFAIAHGLAARFVARGDAGDRAARVTTTPGFDARIAA